MKRSVRRARRVETRALLATALMLALAGCVPPAPPSIKITSPTHGTFIGAGATSMQVSGTIAQIDPADASVTVNGVAAQIQAANKTFSAVVPVNPAEVFQPILADMVKVSNGKRFRDRIVAIRGAGLSDGRKVPDAVALRIRQSGLDDIAPAVAAVLEEQIDLATMLPTDPIAFENATIQVLQSPPASFSAITLAFDTIPNAIDVTGVLHDVFVKVRIDKPGIFQLHCTMEITMSALNVRTRQQLEPAGADGERVGVKQIAAGATEVVVTTSGLNSVVNCENSGLFEQTKEKKLRELIQGNLATALQDLLADPDGLDEPDPAPLAAAIEAQLTGLDLSSLEPVGLRSSIAASFTHIDELASTVDARFDVDVNPPDPFQIGSARSSGLGQTRALVLDPDLPGSLAVPGVFPVLNSGTAHDIGIGLSLSGLNRLLMSETEARRFQVTFDKVTNPDGSETPVTAGTFAVIPQFSALPSDTPITVRVKATLAPVLTGNKGPHDELLEVAVAQVVVTLLRPVTNNGQTTLTELMKLAIDARAGLDVGVVDGALEAVLGTLDQANIRVAVLSNAIGANENLLEVLGPFVLSQQLPDLVDTAVSFPLPSFIGLSLQGTSVSRKDGYLLLFANIVSEP